MIVHTNEAIQISFPIGSQIIRKSCLIKIKYQGKQKGTTYDHEERFGHYCAKQIQNSNYS